MNKAVQFSLMVLWLVGSRAYDAYCTYQFTPDLSREANPLVSILGLGWSPLLAIIGALMIYTLFAYYFRMFKDFQLVPTESGFNFEEFSTYLYFGRKEKWKSLLYKFPGGMERFTHYMGHFFTLCLAYAGIVSTLMWLLLNYLPAYKPLHNTAFIYFLLVAGSLGIIYYENKKLYSRYIIHET